MLVGLKEILKDANEKGYAVPAFNVYNMETVMGVIQAAEEENSPVIMQFYSRLATTGVADYLAPVILQAAKKAKVPVCMHLDHGAGFIPATIAVKNGATGVTTNPESPFKKEVKAAPAEAPKAARPEGTTVRRVVKTVQKPAADDDFDDLFAMMKNAKK